MTSLKEMNDIKWVTLLIQRLIESGIDEDEHWIVPENFILDSNINNFVSKPSNNDIKNINIDLILNELKPYIKNVIEKIVNDYEKT